jgi:hypothetical protein
MKCLCTIFSIDSVSGHITSKLCFCILWDLRVTKCIPMGPGHEMSTHYFLCLGGSGVVSIKTRRIRYAEFVLLHPVGSVGHVVHFGASGVQNVDATFLMLK